MSILAAAVLSADQQSSPQSSQAADGRIHVRTLCLIEKPVILYQPWPKYPPEAVKAGLQGTVRLEAIVGKDGSVKKLKVVSGDPLLAKAATDAVSHWRYKPTLLIGTPVEVETEIDVIFKLPKRTK